MEARTVNNPPSAASHDETVRCVLAIELSKKSWIVAVNTPLSDKVSRHMLEASSMHANAKKIQDLIRLKSIGPEIGTALVGEVFYRQFNNRQQLGSYVGLTPSHFQSGPMSRDQGISKAGNPKARTVMIELAWLWLRHQPNSPLSIWFRERVGTAKGRIRRIAIVAMARKLLITLWRYLETGVAPTATVLKG